MRNGSREKEPRQRWEKDIIDIYSVRWQQQVEWRRRGIDFTKIFEQRRREEDMLSEEEEVTFTACLLN